MTGHAEGSTIDHLNSRTGRGPGGTSQTKRVKLLVSPLIAKWLKTCAPPEEDHRFLNCDYSECTDFADNWAVPGGTDSIESKSTAIDVRPQDAVIDLELSQVQQQFRLGPFHRGRWILNLLSSYSTSDFEQPSAEWTTVCKLVAKRHLPDCSAYQHSPNTLWVYCNFSQSLEVYDILKKKITFQKPAEYFVPTHGVVLDRR